MAPSPIWRRLAGFTLVPALAAVSPLLVLPVVSRLAGPDGWASAIAGESVGTFAAIAVSYGWVSIGPSLVSIARDDTHRGRLYRDALVVRAITGLIALPFLVVFCVLVASPGFEWLSVLMGLQGALIALSFTWFAAGVGDPRSIMFYDAIPRLAVAVFAAVVISLIGFVELYPITGILVTVVGTTIYSSRILKTYPSSWPRPSELPALFRLGAPVALNDAALGTYSSVPTPLANVVVGGTAAAGFASADKMLKLGQFLPLTLANALQSWTGEVTGMARARRVKISLWAHASLGVIGWGGLAVIGPWFSAAFFGEQAAAPAAVCLALGLAFAMYSIRTSMTRHLLFPSGQAHAAMVATLIATAVSIPAMVLLSFEWGTVGIGIGYALAEAIATLLLIRRSRDGLRRIEMEIPVAP